MKKEKRANLKSATLLCVKVEKRRGEEVRRALKERKLLRTDAKIISDPDFIFLPLVRRLEQQETLTLTQETREFEISEPRRSVEDLVGFKPAYEVVGDIAVLTGDRGLDSDRHRDRHRDRETAETDESLERVAAQARAILSLHKNIKVVAKQTSPVEGVFRQRRLKIIAGECRTETTHKENGCRFKLDLNKVYFNPRLATERARVVEQVERSERENEAEKIIDMFAGVGSFAVQIAKRAPHSHVTAIEINPEAVRYLKENIKLNRVGEGKIEAVLGDAREVFKGESESGNESGNEKERFRGSADRIIMNLPKSAHLFLNEALGMLKPRAGTIHFYTLETSSPSPSPSPTHSPSSSPPSLSLETAIKKAKEKLAAGINEASKRAGGREVQLEILNVRKVKTYAPYSFILGIDAIIRK